MQLTAWVNGRFLPLEQATVHIEDRGFQFADGVYEVIACFGGRFLDLKPHLERLERSCSAIDITLPRTLDELSELVEQAYQHNPFEHAMVYIQVTRGVAPRSHLAQQNMVPSLIITVRDLPMPTAEKLEHGVSAITMPDIRWKRCDIKSIALLASVIGKQEASRHGADEGFWLDGQGHVLEGCATNCFAVIDGILVTHPLDHQVLGGITRDMALRVARANAIKVEERAWKLTESGLSECLMSSTTNAVMPVCHIDGKTIGDGSPGPVAIRLRQLMLDEFEALKL
ncbi:D-alanine transaminase [Mariprofundus micogutta]|uniref:branched-chain-amino-acid transaminase n=1 Tax=Mariprofundus micogutta TaxID=1921010 RepID=A0A1L8CLP6_9PROT|nr:D-amino acid aminotransferase [Mariprofundus micogutta]GAV19815.1 D-alanine transaminase [Mariprofundus micogutta]